jgi:hypothetical protein
LDVSSATTKDSKIKIIEDNPAASFIKVLGKSIYYKTSKLILLKQIRDTQRRRKPRLLEASHKFFIKCEEF